MVIFHSYVSLPEGMPYSSLKNMTQKVYNLPLVSMEIECSIFFLGSTVSQICEVAVYHRMGLPSYKLVYNPI